MAGQYYIQIYHGGRFVCDPYLRYEGGEFVRALDVPDTMNWAILENIIMRTIGMINVWEKYHEITLYDDHLVEEDPQVVELLGIGEGVNVPGVNDDNGQEVQDNGAVHQTGHGDLNEGNGAPTEAGEENDEKNEENVSLDDNEKNEENKYRDGFSVPVMGLSDGENDEEVQRALQRKLGKHACVRVRKARSGVGSVAIQPCSGSDIEDPLLWRFMMIENAAGEGDAVARRVESDDDNHSNDAGSINEEGRDAVRKYALVYRRELEFVKNDKDRVRVKCNTSENCPWFIFASDCKISKGFVVKNIENGQRVKKLVRDEIAGNYIDQYKLIWDYANELRVKNPGSTIKGLDTTIIQVLPAAEHRNCARHVYSNWNGKKLGRPFEAMYWNIVKATTERQSEDRFVELRKAHKTSEMSCCNITSTLNSGQKLSKGKTLSGIPCAHACTVIWHFKGEPDDYIHPYYHKETYLKAYAYDLQPINGDHEWAKTGREPLLPHYVQEKTLEGLKTACWKPQAAEAPQNATKKSLSTNAATKARSLPGIVIREPHTGVQARPLKPPGRAPPTEPKGNGKAHATDPINRPCRQRKPSFKGMGLCNQKNGDPKPYYGYSRSKEIAANMYVSSKGASTSAAGSLPRKTSHKGATKGKRKAPADPVRTQESMKKNK
ncbi:Transposase, MuDR, plant [Corchorus olitorius]|uniref:Transposase, MuDR, plant n=1 Tax=Corchorus olitorius TaxID=93759 RepID=A0A1R3J2U6_9ROSI|nr:Transposase, MuDR, plant [Corchorus olitorius]